MSRTKWILAAMVAACLLIGSRLWQPGGISPLATPVAGPEVPASTARPDALASIGEEIEEVLPTRAQVAPRSAIESSERVQPAVESEAPLEIRRTLLITVDAHAPSETTGYVPPSLSSSVSVRASSQALDPSGTKARLRTYRSRWEQSARAAGELQATVEIVLHRPGLVHLATDEPIWNHAIRVDHSSPDPIAIHIEAPVTRYLVLLGNEGPLGPDDANVSIRQVDPAGAGIHRRDPRYDDHRRAWAVHAGVDELQFDCFFRDADLMRVDWTSVEWPGASRTMSIDLSYAAVLRLTVVDDEGNPASLFGESVDAFGPRGRALLRGDRRRHEYWFGVPEFGDYRVIVTDEAGRIVTEQWFAVDGPGEHEFDLVVDD